MKYCTSCGAQLPDNAAFCAKCGAKLPGAKNIGGAPEIPFPGEEAANEPQQAGNTWRGKKTWIAVLAAAGLLLAFLIFLFGFGGKALLFSKRIDLTDYVLLSFSGENGDGRAETFFDTDRFSEDLLQEVEADDWTELTLSLMLMSMTASFEPVVTPAAGLSNGDKVTVRVDFPEEEMKNAGFLEEYLEEYYERISGKVEVRLVSKPARATVRGLYEALPTEATLPTYTTEAASAATTAVPPETKPELTEESSTESVTEIPGAEYVGVWTGSDSYRTMIVIRDDGTLFYCELGNANKENLKGTEGTWQLSNDGSIVMFVSISTSYVLKGKLDNDCYLLQCMNGQPWNDETMYRSFRTEESLKEDIERRLKELK